MTNPFKRGDRARSVFNPTGPALEVERTFAEMVYLKGFRAPFNHGVLVKVSPEPSLGEALAAAMAKPAAPKTVKKWKVTNSTGFDGMTFGTREAAEENARKRAEGSPGTRFMIWTTEAVVVTEEVRKVETQVRTL